MISKKLYNPKPVGSATINSDGSTSSCSVSNYFEVYPVPSWKSGYVLQIHLKWGGNTGNNYYAISSYNTTDKTIFLNSSYFYLYKDNGASNGSISGLGLSSDTEYWIRLSWNGAKYTVEKSTDGTTFTTVGSYNSSSALNTGKQIWFGRSNNNYSFVGMFYFNDTWLKDGNGNIIWSAAELVNASGEITVTEGYYNSGTYTMTPPFTKNDFPNLISGQTLGCKNNLMLCEVTSGSYDYVLNKTATPAGTYLHSQKVTDVYLGPGKDYLVKGSQTEFEFELDNGEVKNTNTGWQYNSTDDFTYDLYGTVSKDIAALFIGQQKDVTNTLYIANQVTSIFDRASFFPGVVNGAFTTAEPNSTYTNYRNVTSSKYTFVKDNLVLKKTKDGLTYEEVGTEFSTPYVVTNGGNNVLIYNTSNADYEYSTDGGDTFSTGTISGFISIQGAILVGAYALATDGTNWYVTGDFSTWETTGITTQNINDATFNGTSYVLYKTGVNSVYSTEDMSTFAVTTVMLQTDIVALDGVFYSGSQSGGIAKSTDGVNWTVSSEGFFQALDVSVCGDALFIKTSSLFLYTTDEMSSVQTCSGISSPSTTNLPEQKLGDYYTVFSRTGPEYQTNGTVFSAVTWDTPYTASSDKPVRLPSGDVALMGISAMYLFPEMCKFTTITASSDPTLLSEDYVDYTDSGYTVTLNSALDTIESVTKNA